MSRVDLNRETASLSSEQRQAIASRSSWVSVWVNICLTIGQLVTGVFAHSQGLIADGLHSLSDLLSDFVVLFANKHSHKAADADHQYGHARFENAASLALGGLLLSVAGVMLYRAVERIQDPSSIPAVHSVALWVAVAAIVAKEGLFRYMMREAKRVNSSMLMANAWHARSDAASSLVVALGVIGNMLGFPVLDPLAAIIVGVLVGRMGWSFGWDALNDLMDRALPPPQVEAIRKVLEDTPGVLNAHDLRTRKMGDSALVDVHLEVDAHISVSEGHHVAVLARRAVLAQFDVLDVQVHIDPREMDAPADVPLPTRRDVVSALSEMLGDVEQGGWQVVLHYINGTLELELRLRAGLQIPSPASIEHHLATALHCPVKVSVWQASGAVA
ncbi:cation diffusion facilitator family transporter [Amantichitinum ursilacus]|uniref:Ferrous-iron efflux pump FieF n=1 Tax=Amantichitinum ursilacus TaxID=857265 RepID=A0A0N1JT90_9NEIS|nr:cation diffusion facilitator family transporter [Amantichitinum ursilacus]KPC53910.1 Ferrous-iron efflux pump FieF [Amantichitinum ursilacus]